MQRRILIGCGAVWLIGLLLVCTFSLGVYLGERGLTRGRAQPTPAAIAPPGRVEPTAPAPPGGPPNVVGTLQRYGDNTLTLSTMQGPRTIALTHQIAVRREQEPALVSDLRPGMALAVWGEPGEGGRVLVARVIMILVAKPQ